MLRILVGQGTTLRFANSFAQYKSTGETPALRYESWGDAHIAIYRLLALRAD